MGKECWAHRGSAKAVPLMDDIQGITDTDVSMRTRMSSGADPNMQGAERPRCPICIGRYGTQVFAVPSPYINIPPFQDWKDSKDGKDGDRYSLHAGGEHCDLALAVEVRRGTL